MSRLSQQNSFWCVSVVFNPAGYKSRIRNYELFRSRLEEQKVNLLTVELAFGKSEFSLPKDERILRLRSNSILWQKERLLNYAFSRLPGECNRIAWLDCDLLLPDGWDRALTNQLEQFDFVQLFEKVMFLEPGETQYGGLAQRSFPGIVWQAKTYGPDWIQLRLQDTIRHAEPGYGWAARRSALKNGLYDRLILGSGDVFLAECLLNCDHLNHYGEKLTSYQKRDMSRWRKKFTSERLPSVGYLPVEVFHLWHGAVADRHFQTRDLISKNFDFNPRKDISKKRNVWEWSSKKLKLHNAVSRYFHERKEDG